MISAMKKLAFVSAALLLLPAFPAAAESPGPTGPALWQVTDEDTTIYLFGTVHVLPKDAVWFEGPIAVAFEASQELVTEVDLAQASTAQQAPPIALLPEGQTLRSLMRDEDRIEYEAALAELGIPPAALDRVKPWFAAINLGLIPVIRKGFDPTNGVDLALTRMAGAKRLAALETVEFQLSLFDSFPLEGQLVYLDAAVERLPQVPDTVDRLLAEWLEGDAAALAELMNTAFAEPDVYDRLVADRNASWAEWIDDRLDQPGTVFLAVGAGHLAGRRSVQELLAARGIAVTRLQ